MNPTLLLLPLLVACARGDVIPPEPETCVVGKYQTEGRECVMCDKSYFGDRNACSDTWSPEGFVEMCKTNGASTWGEVWCNGNAPVLVQEVVDVIVEPVEVVVEPVELPASVDGSGSSGDSCLGGLLTVTVRSGLDDKKCVAVTDGRASLQACDGSAAQRLLLQEGVEGWTARSESDDEMLYFGPKKLEDIPSEASRQRERAAALSHFKLQKRGGMQGGSSFIQIRTLAVGSGSLCLEATGGVTNVEAVKCVPQGRNKLKRKLKQLWKVEANLFSAGFTPAEQDEAEEDDVQFVVAPDVPALGELVIAPDVPALGEMVIPYPDEAGWAPQPLEPHDDSMITCPQDQYCLCDAVTGAMVLCA